MGKKKKQQTRRSYLKGKLTRAINVLEKRGYEVDEELGRFRIVKDGEVLNVGLTKSEVIKAVKFYK